ncbi:MAG: heavy-metal-associated domain-containing protein [Ruminococcus sp.]|nr:heavy-metal-associated domain-containing protein [Ruminococcus sp.]
MLKSIVINVTGMSCSHCEAAVVKACESVDGVEGAKANAKKGIVKIKAANDSVVEAIKAAIKEAGFGC